MTDNPRNLKLLIDYDGTGFTGWQSQPSKKTVQDALKSAFLKILSEDVKVVGAGRTDTGVHARGQVANVIVTKDMPVDKLFRSLNAVLPGPVSIKNIEQVDIDFHSRYDAILRTYSYYIWNEKYESPFYRRFSWWVPMSLDVARMRESAGHFVGKIDLAAFTPEKKKNTIRDVNHVKITNLAEFSNKIIRIDVAANSFPYNFVRYLVGTLVDVGLGKVDADTVKDILNSREFKDDRKKAPAKGLVLERVDY